MDGMAEVLGGGGGVGFGLGGKEEGKGDAVW